MTTPVVISASNISKYYRLGVIGSGTVREDLQRWFRRIRRSDQKQVDSFRSGGTLSQQGEIWALRDVSFDVEQGEVLGIIGRNGAGKSTLLKILSRITAQTSGEIRLKGRVASLLEVGTGFHPELTGRENVFLNGAILGMTKAEVRRSFDEIVSFAEIEKFIDTPVKRYSSGMYVRLAFAVAAHLEPEILLVDEVLAVGDLAFQKKCLGKMTTVASQGRTVLFVSHNMTAVSALCTRALFLKQGAVEMQGDVNDAIQTYYGEVSKASGAVVEFPGTNENHPSLTRACVIQEDGKPTKHIQMGRPFGIQIEFKSPTALRDPSLGIRVNTAMGITVLGATNHMHRAEPLIHSSTHGVIKVLFPVPCLNQGIYYLTLTLSSDGTIVSRLPDALSFDIFQSDIFGTGRVPSPTQSLLAVKATWLYSEPRDDLWKAK